MEAAAGRLLAHPRETGAGPLLQIALRRADPDRHAGDTAHLPGGAAEGLLRDVVSPRPHERGRRRRHRSGDDRPGDREALRAAQADAPLGHGTRSHGPRPHRDPGHRRCRRRGAVFQRLGAAQAAEAPAGHGGRLSPRSSAGADVPDAQPALQRDLAAVRRAVSRGGRRHAGAGRRDDGHLTRRASDRRRPDARPRGAARRSQARPPVRLHGGRARSRQAIRYSQATSGPTRSARRPKVAATRASMSATSWTTSRFRASRRNTSW